MFSTQPSELLANRAFLFKMGLLAAAGCNAAVVSCARRRCANSTCGAGTDVVVHCDLAGVVFCGRWIAY